MDPEQAETVYARIKRAIVCVDIPADYRLTAGEVVAKYGTDESSARQALEQLDREGLLEHEPDSGYRVTPVTLDDARELCAVRVLLEGEAASRAATRLEDVERLQDLEDLCQASYDPDNPQSIREFLRLNTRFHTTVAELGGNARLARMLAQVLEELERLFHIGLASTSRVDEVVHEHRDLVDAIVAGDANAAADIARSQAYAAQKMVVEALLTTEPSQRGTQRSLRVVSNHTRASNHGG